MKKIFFSIVFFSIIIISGCKLTPDVPEELPPIENHDEESGDGATEDLPDEPPITDTIDGPVDMESIVLALYDGSTLRLWDGENLTDAYVGHVVTAGSKKLAFEDVLYYFGENGELVHSQWLPVVPDKMIAVESDTVPLQRAATTVYQDDIITLENIPPEDAYALGARYKNYTRILENGVEIGAWYLNEWKVTEVLQTASGHILAIDELRNYHNLTDDKHIENAYSDGIMTYDMGTQHGYISDGSGEYEITWTMNFFDHSRWQFADGVWYTENGYSWTPETGVLSAVNEMYGWNVWETMPETYNGYYAEMPYLLPAGVVVENGEEVTYWIECNSGMIYRHIPSIDRLDMMVELYEGPRTRAGGIPYFNTLNPQMIDGKMYYHESNAIKTFDLTTGLISVFSTDQEVIEW